MGRTTKNSKREDSRRPQIQRQQTQRRPSKKSYRKKKRKRYNYPRIIALLASFIFIVVISIIGIRSCVKKTVSFENNAVSENGIIKKNITVNGSSIKGLTKEEAKTTILADMNWAIKVSYGDDIYQLPNLFESVVEEIVEEIFDIHSLSAQEEYKFNTYNIPQDEILSEIRVIADRWDIPAKDAGISEYNTATNTFLFSPEKSGTLVNQEKLFEDIKMAMEKVEYKTTLIAEGQESFPQLTEAQAREQYTIIGTFSTTTTNNKDRNQNITLACEAINGQVIQKGEVFSMNDATGERTTEKGYKPAGAYVNGELVEEPGGGVCQVSSTLYNAVILAGLNTMERNSHSYTPTYVKAGEDAMISYPGLDMKFENDTIDALGILASLKGNSLTISIYGIPLLEEGITVEMYSELRETLPIETTYVEDPTLELGTEELEKKGTAGTKVVTYLITKKDGIEISRDLLHNSSYRGKAEVIRRNTGVESTTNPEETLPNESPDIETTKDATTQSAETEITSEEPKTTTVNEPDPVSETTEELNVENPGAE